SGLRNAASPSRRGAGGRRRQFWNLTRGKNASLPPTGPPDPLLEPPPGRQGAKEAMQFIPHSGSKVDLMRVRVSAAIAGDKGPKVINLDRGPVGALQLAEEVICL